MKYAVIKVINVDIKTNEAKIKYANIKYVSMAEGLSEVPTLRGWTDNINEAYIFDDFLTASKHVNNIQYLEKERGECIAAYKVGD